MSRQHLRYPAAVQRELKACASRRPYSIEHVREGIKPIPQRNAARHSIPACRCCPYSIWHLHILSVAVSVQAKQVQLLPAAGQAQASPR